MVRFQIRSYSGLPAPSLNVLTAHVGGPDGFVSLLRALGLGVITARLMVRCPIMAVMAWRQLPDRGRKDSSSQYAYK